MKGDTIFLKVGDSSSDGKIHIIDEDRLCFQVRGTNGSIRTISKDLLREFIEYFNQHPNASSADARKDLTGRTDIDKFEYGYNGTLTKLSELNKALYLKRKQSASLIKDKIANLPLQQIFFGAPGTGKSFAINEVCADFENYRTTFHPDTDYASFVGSYKPITIQACVRDMTGHPVTEDGKEIKESRIVYRYVMQAFLKAYVAAWREQQNDEPKSVFLIVEEINRGNCAQIFGDIFQLLDRNAAGFSDYPIVADDDLAQELKEILGEFSIAKHDAINALYSGGKDIVGMVKNGECPLLPNNMYIWATMNTSDQSLFPIDSAFKRRWDWNYIKIKDAGENFKIVFSNGNTYDWWNFVSAINERIEGGEIQQEDKKLGYFFAKAKDKVITPKVLLSKVLFYLYNDVFKDFGLDEDFFKDENGETMSFASYFDNNGQINENRVERFVTNLGLEPEFTDYTEEVDELTVNGKKMRYITDAVFEILSEAAKSNTSEAIFDAVDEIFADRDDVVKSIDNPDSYEKENRWNKTPIIANDGTAFVVSNQWHKNEIRQVQELAKHFNIHFEENALPGDDTNNQKKKSATPIQSIEIGDQISMEADGLNAINFLIEFFKKVGLKRLSEFTALKRGTFDVVVNATVNPNPKYYSKYVDEDGERYYIHTYNSNSEKRDFIKQIAKQFYPDEKLTILPNETVD